MADNEKERWRRVTITPLRGEKAGKVAVTFELTPKDWAWMQELEDRRMIPLPDLLMSGFHRGMEEEGWKNPDHVTTPSEPPPRREWKETQEPPTDRTNVEQIDSVNRYGLDDDLPF